MKVGDYVRTKDNKIYKIIDKKFDETILIDLYQTDISGYLMEIDIKKSSPNIIDLIEVGDYVNGDKVEKSKYGELYTGYVYCGGDIGRTEESYTLFLKEMDEEDIESILTKEQFESMEYRIGE